MTAAIRPSDIVQRDDPPPPVGHNSPPPYDPDAYVRMVEGVQDFAAAGGEWLDLEKIETDKEAQYLVDFVSGARKKLKDVEAWRVDAKRPHDLAAKMVQDAARRPVDTLDRVIKRALDLLTPYQQRKKREADERAAREREEARKKAEEAARLAEQAAARNDIAGEIAAEAQAKEAALQSRAADKMEATGGSVQSASGGGRTVALVTVRTVAIEQPMQVFMFFRDRPEVLDVLQRLSNAHVRAAAWDGKDIPGTKTVVEERAR